jgi:hypothetical protein
MLELGLVTWLALTIGRSSREVPVCEACGRRLSREKHLGGTVPANEALLLELVRRHDLQTLGHLLEKDAGLPSVEVYLRRCEACRQGPGRLTVRRATLGSRGVQLADLAESPLGPGDSALFLAGLRFEEE